MDFDDLEPKRKSSFEIGADLSLFSVADLATLIETLKSEIVRVEETLATKKTDLSSAHSAFKS